MRNNSVRLLDMGEVSYLRSQTIYHAVASAQGVDGPDTIVLMSPRQPYACIGYHQDLDQEIDLEYCRTRQMPVLRREIGGGTVYLDGGQLFYHCIFHRRRAPRRVDDIYGHFLRGPVETYRQLGVDARLRSANDIVAGDRKIGGTGAGTIGEAVVVCGSIIFDFDHSAMARLLRMPSEAFRRQFERNLRNYVTSLRSELGREVSRDGARDLLVAKFGEALEVEIRPGKLTAAEWGHIERLDALFVTDEWLRAISRPPSTVRQVKIRAGVVICEATHQDNGGAIQVTLSLADGRIDDVDLHGDLGLGRGQLRMVKAALVGKLLDSEEVYEAMGSLACQMDGSGLSAVQSCLTSIHQAVRKNYQA